MSVLTSWGIGGWLLLLAPFLYGFFGRKAASKTTLSAEQTSLPES